MVRTVIEAEHSEDPLADEHRDGGHRADLTDLGCGDVLRPALGEVAVGQVRHHHGL